MTPKQLRRKEYQREYYLANKSKIVDRAKTRYKANREAIIDKQLARHRNHNLPCTIVYVIPNYDGLGNDYVGITKNIQNRLAKHKSLGKLNTKKWDILDIEYDRAKARELERDFHLNGYHGGRKKKVTN